MRDLLPLWARRSLGSVVLVGSIGLATAVATTIIAAANAVLWRDLPVVDPEALVTVVPISSESKPGGELRSPLYAQQYDLWRAQQDVFDGLAAYQMMFSADLQLGDHIEGDVSIVRVTGNFFELLGVQPSVGRMFTAQEAEAEGGHLVVLSHHGWTRLFGRDASVVGRSVSLLQDGDTVIVATIAGVAARGLDLNWTLDGRPVDLFTILPHGDARLSRWNVVGRLRSGVTSPVAQARMVDIAIRTIRDTLPDVTPPAAVRVTELHEELFGFARPLVRLLVAIGALVVLIACTSAAGAMVAVVTGRARDLAIQQALGRAGYRIRASLLLEGAGMGLLAGVVALLGSWLLMRAVAAIGPASIPRLADIQLGWFEAAAAGLLAAGCGLVVGLLPACVVRLKALQILRESVATTLSKAALMHRRVLLAAQLAFVLALLVTAGLMLATLHGLVSRPLGFSIDRVLVAEFRVPGGAGPRQDGDQSRVFVDRVLAAVRAAPGQRTVALASDAPLDGGTLYQSLVRPDNQKGVHVALERVGPGYFSVLGIPILAGSDLPTYDGTSGAVLVNDTFARENFGSPTAAVGRAIDWASQQWMIVGVVGDTRQKGLKQTMAPVVYVPLIVDTLPGGTLYGRLRVVTREEGDFLRAIGDLRTATQSVDSRLAVHVAPLADRFRNETAEERLLALSLGVLAGSTLLLSALGIGALVGQLVTDRVRELAIRLALGSPRTAVLRVVMNTVLAPTAAGIVAGLVLAWWAVGLIRPFLFETPSYDMTLWTSAVLVLVSAVLLGAFWPATRAIRLDPAQVLRWE